MSVLIKESRPQLDENALKDVESNLGIMFPNEYRAFILRNNGGYPEPGVFEIPDSEGKGHVAFFLCICESSESSFELFYKVLKNRIPEDTIPIAYDDYGNFLLIGHAGEKIGKVYFWDHEKELEGVSDCPSEQCCFVANDFDSFLSALGPE